jgi:hypothetical protein
LRNRLAETLREDSDHGIGGSGTVR